METTSEKAELKINKIQIFIVPSIINVPVQVANSQLCSWSYNFQTMWSEYCQVE